MAGYGDWTRTTPIRDITINVRNLPVNTGEHRRAGVRRSGVQCIGMDHTKKLQGEQSLTNASSNGPSFPCGTSGGNSTHRCWRRRDRRTSDIEGSSAQEFGLDTNPSMHQQVFLEFGPLDSLPNNPLDILPTQVPYPIQFPIHRGLCHSL